MSIERPALIARIVDSLGDDDCLVASLGFIARDAYAFSEARRAQCVYCLGSMGNVIPLGVGIAAARPALRVVCLEGDGSLLMNLGCLATVRRYGGRLQIVVVDNGCYESTGGQPSQPERFRLEEVCAAIGLPTMTAETLADVDAFLARAAGAGPSALVAKTSRGQPCGRIPEAPPEIARRFGAWLAGK